jgi:hypothetical protein
VDESLDAVDLDLVPFDLGRRTAPRGHVRKSESHLGSRVGARQLVSHLPLNRGLPVNG